MNLKLNIVKLLFISVSVLATFSCKDDELTTPVSSTDYDNNFFIIRYDEKSRLTHEDMFHSKFDDGDRVGVFVIDDNCNPVGNLQNVEYAVFSTTSLTRPELGTYQSLKAVDGMEVKRDAPAYLLYYPYEAQMTLERAKSLTHTVMADQTSPQNYTTSDILWEIIERNNRSYVDVVMDHAMANVIVMLSKKDYPSGADVTVLNLPISAKNIDYTSDGCDNLKYDILAQPTSDIKMWSFGENDTYFYFRAAIPACHTILGGTKFLKVENSAGIKEYRIKNDAEGLELLPGRNYIFTAGTVQTPVIPEGTDDSWVLDVLDPITGEIVGLLCREYLYYAPVNSNYHDANAYNGTTPNSGYQFLNSQFLSGLGGASVQGFFTDSPWRKNLALGKELPGLSDDDPTFLPNENDPTPQSTYSKSYDLDEEIKDIDDYFVLNSQAWVFYKLKKNGKPDLSKGKIMRVTYDFEPAGSGLGNFTPRIFISNRYTVIGAASGSGVIWPAPHQNRITPTGLFIAKHGRDYIPNGSVGVSSEQYRPDAVIDMYIHGAEIWWDFEYNRISYVTPPSQMRGHQIPTFEAEANCHISIPRKSDGTIDFDNVDVSYDPILNGGIYDAKSNAVGVLEQHFIIDTRLDIRGQPRTIKYPIVKIGSNQFWMARSLRCFALNNNTSLLCYNDVNPDPDGEPLFKIDIDSNGKPEITSPGFLFPGGKDYTDIDGTKVNFAPSNYMNEQQVLDLKIGLLYNWEAVHSGHLTPKSSEFGETYKIPKFDDINRLYVYLGPNFTSKIFTDQTRIYNGDVPVNDVKTALEHGRTLEMASYCANITGLNLKAYGYYAPWRSKYAGMELGMFLSSEGTKLVRFFNLTLDYVFSDKGTLNDYTPVLSQDENYRYRAFAQVRCFMEFDDQQTEIHYQPGVIHPMGSNTSKFNRQLQRSKERNQQNIYLKLSE